MEGQPGAFRLLHQRELLSQQAGDIHCVGGSFARFAPEKGMVSVDVNDIPLRKAFRAVLPEEIQADSNACSPILILLTMAFGRHLS